MLERGVSRHSTMQGEINTRKLLRLQSRDVLKRELWLLLSLCPIDVSAVPVFCPSAPLVAIDAGIERPLLIMKRSIEAVAAVFDILLGSWGWLLFAPSGDTVKHDGQPADRSRLFVGRPLLWEAREPRL
jgi:hypothetical protein